MPTKQSIFWPYNKSAFSILCVLMKACSLANAKHKAKRLDDFKFRTFIGPSQVTWQGKTNKSAKFEITHSADYSDAFRHTSTGQRCNVFFPQVTDKYLKLIPI